MSKLTNHQIHALLPGMRARAERLAKEGHGNQAAKVLAKYEDYLAELKQRRHAGLDQDARGLQAIHWGPQ